MGRRLRRGCREVGIEFWYRDWTSPISDAVRARSLTRLKYTEFRDDGVGVFGKKPALRYAIGRGTRSVFAFRARSLSLRAWFAF
jgi:hypothetical protein